MPQPRPLFYQSPDAKKTILLAMFGLLSVVIAGYTVMFFQIKQAQTTAVTVFADEVTTALNYEIDDAHDGFSDVLTNTRFDTMHYEFIVFSPTGKTSVLSNRATAEKIHLPNWQLAQKNQDTLVSSSDGYEIWRQLSGGYTLYGEITPPPLLTYFLHPMYLLPFGIAVLVFLVMLSYLSQYYKMWQELIQYTQTLPQRAIHTYQPLNLTYPNTRLEMAQMNQALNRTAFELHQSIKKNHHLTSRQQLLVENAPVALFLTSRSGQITYFNPSFAQIFKTPYQPDVIYHLTDFITGKDKHTQQIISHLAQFNYTHSLSVTDLSRNQFFDLHFTPTYNQFGQLRGYSGSLEVVDTYHLQLEQAWLNDKHQQEKLAQFSKLWAVLGHEMRTPLSGMIGMLALLNEDKSNLTTEQHDLLNSLTESSDNMLQLLNDMLDMAKLDAGKLRTNRVTTDLLKLCRSVCSLMAGNARRQNIELLYHTDPLIPRFLSTDEGRLRQILLNLINNAIKFTQQGYVALLLDLAPSTDPIIAQKAFANQTADTWLKITIKDTGIGISEQDQQKLFAYFNQANDSISQQFGGTGIGLALSKNFTQMLGGFIHLTSVVGEGSEFQVYLPLDHYHPQPVFPYNTQPYGIELVFFTAHTISQRYVEAIIKQLGIPAQVMVGIDETIVARLNAQSPTERQQVFVVDDICFEQSPSLFRNITHFSTVAKILFSMQSQQNISPTILSEFDGFVPKPIYVSNFMAELSRVVAQQKPDLSQPITLTAQQAFNKFLQKIGQENSALTQPTKSIETAIALLPSPMPKTILLAEDNLINQKIAQKQLEKLGYAVIVAENGQQALQLLHTHREDIALILMDCNMPIMDGLEATRQIRASQDSIPIIALTANESDSDRQQCIKAGMDNFISKPLSKQDLATILNRYMI